MDKLLERISIDKIVRYGYCGFLILLIFLILVPQTSTYLQTVGAVISTIIALTFGACFYVIYRYLLGEYLLFPFMHLVHYLFEKATRQVSSPHTLFGQLGVSLKSRRTAYNLIRQNYFDDPKQAKTYDFAHSEIHLVYITSVILFLTAMLFRCHHLVAGYAFGVLIISAIALLSVGIIIDIQQHSMEYRRLNDEKEKVQTFLKKHFLIKS